MDSKNSLGNKLKSLRNEHNFNQEYVAKKLCVTHQTISNWENDKSEPDKDTLIQICRFYNISPNQLLDFGKTSDDPPTEAKGSTLGNFEPASILEVLVYSVVLVLMSQFAFVGLIVSILIFIRLIKTKQKRITIYLLCILCFIISLRGTYLCLDYIFDFGHATIEKIN